MTTDGVKEIILPSGGFARVRILRGADFLQAQLQIAKNPGMDLLFTLMTIAVTIDSQPVTYQQLLDMDLRDVFAIQTVMGEYVRGPVT